MTGFVGVDFTYIGWWVSGPAYRWQTITELDFWGISTLACWDDKNTGEVDTLPETNSSPLKMDAWNTILSYWVSAYFQGLC